MGLPQAHGRVGSTFGLKVTALIAVAAVVLIAYWPASGLGFFGDDWIFYDLAGRLSVSDYFARYLNPAVQTAWYRPVQGVLYWIEFQAFGANPLGYHFLNVLAHVFNCLLLFALTQKVSGRLQIGVTAALLFASLPTAALAVFWPGVIDTIETGLYLTAIWFWLSYLHVQDQRNYWLAFGFFILAMLTKEIGVTLPVTLFLIDFCWVREPAFKAKRILRYGWFVLVWSCYAPFEFMVVRRSVFPSHEGYQLGPGMLSTLVDYLSKLVFPWSFVPGLSYAALLIAIVTAIYLVFVKRTYTVVPPIIGAILAILLVAPFPLVADRFLYLPLLVPASAFAWWLDRLLNRRSRGQLYRMVGMAAVVFIVLDGSGRIQASATDFAGWQRVEYATFLKLIQAHPPVPNDSLYYFVDPPVPSPVLSGMLLRQYGPGVLGAGTDSDQWQPLRDHPYAAMVYWDAQGNPEQLDVERESPVNVLEIPVRYASALELEDYLVSAVHVTPGGSLGLVFHWRVQEGFDPDASVLLQIVSGHGDVLLADDARLIGREEQPGTLNAGDLFVHARVITIPRDAPAGKYRLQVVVHGPSIPGGLTVLDRYGNLLDRNVVIEPFLISE